MPPKDGEILATSYKDCEEVTCVNFECRFTTCNPKCRGYINKKRFMGKVDSTPLKLYVWEGVLRVYGTGVMFALASNVGDARKLLLLKYKEDFLEESLKGDLEKEPKVYTRPFAFALEGSC